VKVRSLIAGMIAGADGIERMNLLCRGTIPVTFGDIYAPSPVSLACARDQPRQYGQSGGGALNYRELPGREVLKRGQVKPGGFRPSLQPRVVNELVRVADRCVRPVFASRRFCAVER
jgi:hypothetical protein